eukprot:COSAG02_NODE_22_length_53020_cov_16.223125_12_plen_68_part_00
MGAELASIRIIDRARAPTLQIAAIFTNLVANSIDESDSRRKHLAAPRARVTFSPGEPAMVVHTGWCC